MTVFRDEAAQLACAEAASRFRARLPLPMQERQVQTPYGTTAALVGGAAQGTPLVLLHGAMASAAHLLGELHPLGAQRPIIGVEVLGQSPMSANTRVPLTRADAWAWLGAVLDGLGVERCDLLGVSWGGYFAARAAASAPERFRTLTLLVPTGLVPTPAWPAMRQLGLPMLGWRVFGHKGSLQALVDALFTDTDPAWSAWLGLAMQSYNMDFRAPPLPEPGELSPWAGPTLVVGADEDVSVPGEAVLAGARAVWPHAETELLRKTRHSPSMRPEARAALCDRIARFLDGA